MSDLVKLISVAKQYLLTISFLMSIKLTDLAVNFCRNVFGVVSALRIISAEEYFRVIVSVYDRTELSEKPYLVIILLARSVARSISLL